MASCARNAVTRDQAPVQLAISAGHGYGNMGISTKLVKSLKLESLVGEDGKHYIFRVLEMRKYLASALGASSITVLKDFDSAFAKQTGIIAFDVLGWKNTSGHLALWNGQQFREPSHDDYRGLKDDPATPIKESETKGMSLWKL